MRMAICDANVTALLKSVRMFDQYLFEHDREAEIDVFVSADDLLAKREGGQRYDMYLLEAKHPKLDGIALGYKIRETQPDVPIVYVAESDEGVRLSSGVSPVGCVRKPCEYKTFAAAFDRACCGLWGTSPVWFVGTSPARGGEK